jgi:hypothetical protein
VATVETRPLRPTRRKHVKGTAFCDEVGPGGPALPAFGSVSMCGLDGRSLSDSHSVAFVIRCTEASKRFRRS